MKLRIAVWVILAGIISMTMGTGYASTFTKKVSIDSDDAVELSGGESGNTIWIFILVITAMRTVRSSGGISKRLLQPVSVFKT